MSEIVTLKPKAGDVGFIDTPTSRRITFVARDCHINTRLAVIRGGFGVGKSHTLRRYEMECPPAAVLVSLNPVTRSATGALAAIGARLNELSEDYGIGRYIRRQRFAYCWEGLVAARQTLEAIAGECGHALLIVDEAQHARPDVFDVLRTLLDDGVCGLVIAGNERLFDARRGRIEVADFGALLGRAAHVIDIPAPTPEDIDAVLDAHKIAGQEARALLHECAAAGGIRELVHVVGKAREVSGAPLVRFDHLKAASATTGLLSASGWSRRSSFSRQPRRQP